MPYTKLLNSPVATKTKYQQMEDTLDPNAPDYPFVPDAETITGESPNTSPNMTRDDGSRDPTSQNDHTLFSSQNEANDECECECDDNCLEDCLNLTQACIACCECLSVISDCAATLNS